MELFITISIKQQAVVGTRFDASGMQTVAFPRITPNGQGVFGDEVPN